MQISDKLLLIITAAFTAISAFFCLIGLATPRWTQLTGLFCSGCGSGASSAAGLSIVALLLLVAAVVILLLNAVGMFPKSIRLLAVAVLFVAGIFTLSALAAFFHPGTGYSYRLMVFAHVLCYIATILASFWMGTSYTANINQTI
ncbi:unnamed protein product [Adineta ricciae]|uniref:Uncharacterized protein n=1 Tax=Adineta ricciae TaxID=249248 RepID=A0A814BR13_ADIRI|nr:unnamed protein product [Adineta ricciae]CAF0976619.1 unnamed protein product [Adineta ricciae]